MSLKEKIQKDLNQTLKEKKEIEILTLRQLSAAILNKEKEKRFKISKGLQPALHPPAEQAPKPDISEKELEKESQLIDEEVIEVISSEIKKRKEAILEYEKGEREDLVEKEKKEMEILQRYLPEQLSEEELKKLAKEAIDKVGASNLKDMGKIMAELVPQIKGKADGSLVSKIVKELLEHD